MCIVTLSVLGGVLGTTFGAIGSAIGAGTATAAVATAAGASAATAASAAATASVVAGVGVTVAADLAITGAVVGGVLSTVGAVQQAEQQQAQAEFYAEQEAENARLANRRAEAIEVMGNQERRKLRLQMLDQKSAARTGYAASGVVLGSGSTLDYEADIADAYDLDSRNLEYDIESRKWQQKVAAANASSQAAMYRDAAKAAGRSKTVSLIGGIFNTIGSAGSAALSAFSAVNTLGKLGAAAPGAGSIATKPSSVGINLNNPTGLMSKIPNMA